MADDAAHIPAGPIDATSGTEPVFAAEPGVASTGEPTIMQDRVADNPADADVELVGRQLSPSARLGERELVGAAPGAAVGRADSFSSAPVASASREPSAWRNPAIDLVDDAPRWSFGAPDEDLAGEIATPEHSTSQAELPFAPSAAPAAPAQARAMPLFGPAGRLRSALAVPLLAVVTLGVYALVWHYRVNQEMELFDPKLHSRPRRSLLAVIVPWLTGTVVTLAGAALILTTRFGVQLPFDPHVTSMQAYYLLGGLAVVPYLTLLLPFSAVAVVMTLERLRSVEEHAGATTDRQVRPVASSLLLLVPVIGGLLMVGLAQRRLNAIWQRVAPSGHLYS